MCLCEPVGGLLLLWELEWLLMRFVDGYGLCRCCLGGLDGMDDVDGMGGLLLVFVFILRLVSSWDEEDVPFGLFVFVVFGRADCGRR